VRKNKLISLIIFILNILVVFGVIIFISENPFLNIMLALYLTIYSSFYYYNNRKK